MFGEGAAWKPWDTQYEGLPAALERRTVAGAGSTPDILSIAGVASCRLHQAAYRPFAGAFPSALPWVRREGRTASLWLDSAPSPCTFWPSPWPDRMAQRLPQARLEGVQSRL